MSDRAFEVEEVNEAKPVAKAPPLRAMQEAESSGHSPDYLDGFLKQKPEPAPADASSDLVDEIVAALRQIHDPEIPVNIYDLGLIYGVEVDNGHACLLYTSPSPRD